MPLHLVGGSPRFNEVNLDILNAHLAPADAQEGAGATLRLSVGTVLDSSKVRDVALLFGKVSFEATYMSPTPKTEAHVRLQINDRTTKRPHDTRSVKHRADIDHWLGKLLGVSTEELLDDPVGQFDKLAQAPRPISFPDERYRLAMTHEKDVGHGRHLTQRRDYEETIKGVTRGHEYVCSLHRRVSYPRREAIVYSQYVDLEVADGKITGSRSQETDPKTENIEHFETLLRQPCDDGHENHLIGGLKGPDINDLFSGAIDFEDMRLHIDTDPFADTAIRNRSYLRLLRPQRD